MRRYSLSQLAIERAIGAALLATQAGLLAWSAYIHSPTQDEVGYLPAGISHWEFGRFELYRANPPLVRLVAALPVIAAGYDANWGSYVGTPGSRTELPVGGDFLDANRFRSFWLFTIARWACIPFALLGGMICWCWADELYKPPAGLAALALWTFCPNVLGNGALITPDVATTSLGLAAAYTFWHWLRAPDWTSAVLAGLVMGLALFAKTNWLILFALWPLLWAIWRLSSRHTPCAVPSSSRHTRCAVAESSPHAPREEPLTGRHAPRDEPAPLVLNTSQLTLILSLAILVINAGYGFDGTGKALGDFQFLSHTLRATSEPASDEVDQLGNRFRGTWLGAIPVPVPEQFVLGIDVQKHAVEKGRMAYLFGVWKFRGWWYYYLAAATVKVPVGIWLLLAIAIGVRLANLWPTLPASAETATLQSLPASAPTQAASATWRDELILLAPAIATLIFISSQTGINRHFRYALPVFPFLFVWLSSLAPFAIATLSLRPSFSPSLHLAPACLIGVAFAWAMVSSLLVYPHSLSYFNEIAGGPRGGPRFLLDSNTDWGQDLLLLKQWIDRNPEKRPVYVNWRHNVLNVALAGIDAEPAPTLTSVGWHAISTNDVFETRENHETFTRHRIVDTVGGSLWIVQIPSP
jgi:hypothetical protein